MAEMMKKGIIFDIQSLSFHDGPGIRTLIFLKGCPLNCLWCANPEGQRPAPEIRYQSVNCTGCLKCLEACPNNSIQKKSGLNEKIQIHRDICLKCKDLKCVEACNYGALDITGEIMTVGQVMNIVKRDSRFYRGKGGVTLSGGDPTYQSEFAVEVLKACQEEFISTAVESAMFINSENADKFIPYTDVFLLDIKHIDSNKHKKLTGVPNEQILNNIIRISKQKEVLIRVPIIPGLNDDDDNILGIADFCLKNKIEGINILPYHKLGLMKYDQLGIEYKIPHIQLSLPDRLEHIKGLIENSGLRCIKD